MNTFQKASITSLLSTFALVSSALAAENEELQFTQEQIFNSDKCISEVMSLEGRTVEEFADWVRLVGKSINMQVTPFTSLTHSGLKMLKIEDDFHGSNFTMHLKDQYCYITENTFESLSPTHLKEAPEKDKKFEMMPAPKMNGAR